MRIVPVGSVACEVLKKWILERAALAKPDEPALGGLVGDVLGLAHPNRARHGIDDRPAAPFDHDGQGVPDTVHVAGQGDIDGVLPHIEWR